VGASLPLVHGRTIDPKPEIASEPAGIARSSEDARPHASSPFGPFPCFTEGVRLWLSRLRGRAVRRASHDSMSLGRFRFVGEICPKNMWGQLPSAVRRSEGPLLSLRQNLHVCAYQAEEIRPRSFLGRSALARCAPLLGRDALATAAGTAALLVEPTEATAPSLLLRRELRYR
jgi:hypothetical protein